MTTFHLIRGWKKVCGYRRTGGQNIIDTQVIQSIKGCGGGLQTGIRFFGGVPRRARGAKDSSVFDGANLLSKSVLNNGNNIGAREIVEHRAIGRFVKRHMWPDNQNGFKIRVALAVVVLVAGKLANVQVPVLFKDIIDGLSGPNIDSLKDNSSDGANKKTGWLDFGGYEVLLSVGTVIAGYALAKGGSSALSELKNALFSKVTQGAVRRISLDAFNGLHLQPYSVHTSRSTGTVTRVVERGTRGIQFLVSSLVFNVGPTVLEVGLVAGMLGTQFGSPFAIVTIGCVASYTGMTILLTQWRTRIRQAMNQADNQAAAIQLDSLLNYETVKYFSGEKLEAKRYDTALLRYEDSAVKTATSLAVLNTVQNGLVSGSLGLLMALSAIGVSHGSMTIGDLVMANTLLFQLSIPLNFLGTVYREITQATLDLKGLVVLLNKDPNFGATTTSTSNNTTSDYIGMSNTAVKLGYMGSIELTDVRFRYSDNQPYILDGISLSIPLGSSVAFIGASGSGKSTLVRLLFGFYPPTEGSIMINPNQTGQSSDTIDIGRGGVNNARKYIGVVPQDPILFNESIGYNIAYPHLSEQANCVNNSFQVNSEQILDERMTLVREAAVLAGADSFIRGLDSGYGTQVGERGIRLSGGEKQRIAIARALLRDPPILLLDEATSALDTTTERLVINNLVPPAHSHNQLEPKRTLIFIAHRLSTIEHCDMIYVLDKGKIIEFGTHDQLKLLNGIYTEMLNPKHT